MAKLVLLTAALLAAVGAWEQTSNVPAADHQIELVFALRHPEAGVAALEKELLERSDPSSPLYSKWLTNNEAHALVDPAPHHKAAVYDHLAAHVSPDAISFPTPNGDFVIATVPVATAERLLGVSAGSYKVHAHGPTKKTCVRLASDAVVSLPPQVREAVVMVEPTHRMPPLRKAVRAIDTAIDTDTDTDTDTVENLGTTPTSLRALYNVTDVGSTGGKNPTGHAVTAFLEQYYSASDFSSFWSEYAKEATGGVAKPDPTLVGDATKGDGGVESMLDIEYVNAMGAGIHSEFWGFSGRGGNPENEPFLKWLYTMGNTSDAAIPKVFSTSYGEDEKSTTEDEADRMNAEFMKAGARGISLMYASGDEGANCKGGKYVPEWPSSSPYITAVGGTTGSGTESAASLSSGGFSNRYAMPAWQTEAVEAYLKNQVVFPDSNVKLQGQVASFPKPSYYNASGRAYPDVSAQATGFMVVAGGGTEPGVAGTSCASPTFSGVLALVVDKRLAAGKTSLGFLNPLIYKTLGPAGALNDITSGSSSGCGFFSSGWPARKGWDAVTGYGTPNYGKMLEAAMALQ